jgi:hypothetical protein
MTINWVAPIVFHTSYNYFTRTEWKIPFAGTCLPFCCLETACITPLFIRVLHNNGCTLYNIKILSNHENAVPPLVYVFVSLRLQIILASIATMSEKWSLCHGEERKEMKILRPHRTLVFQHFGNPCSCHLHNDFRICFVVLI